MRVNPNIPADLLAALSNAQQQQDTAMLQMASGRRVNKPSDDPAGAAVLIQNQAQQNQNDSTCAAWLRFRPRCKPPIPP